MMMRQKSMSSREAADKSIRDIRRKTRKHRSPEEKIRIVLAGLRGEESIAALCRREAIAESLYYGWSKEFLEAGDSTGGRWQADSAYTPQSESLARVLLLPVRGTQQAVPCAGGL